MRSRPRDLALVALLLFAMDQLYRVLKPEVDLVRACLVGATAFATLRALEAVGLRSVPAAVGGLAVLASAFGSVLAIEAGWLVSRSWLSVAVHLALLAVALEGIEWARAGRGYRRREASTARTRSSGTSAGGGPSSSAPAASRSVSR